MKDGKPESLAEALLLLEKMNARLSEKDQKIREQQYDNLFKYYHFSSIASARLPNCLAKAQITESNSPALISFSFKSTN